MIPKVRFPEFTDQWVSYSMGDLYKEHNEHGNDSLPILSVSIHSGVSKGEMDEEQLGKHVKRSENKTQYKHVYSGDLVFNMMRAWQGAIGVASNEGMISPAYISAIPNAYVYPPFMNYLVQRPEVISQINDLSYGVMDFRKRLYWDSFVKLQCALPSIEEQKKIVIVFERVDRLIDDLQNKLNDMSSFKKVMLQKMFPKEGEDVPEIRFPGFTDAWEQRKLGELAEFNPKSVIPETFEYVDLESVVGTDILSHRTENKATAPSRAQRLAQGGDVFYQTVRPYQKNNCIFEKPDNNWVFSTGYAQLRPNGDGYFLLALLQNDAFVRDVLDRCTGTSYPAINSNDLADIEVITPVDISEQKKIGELFKLLDNTITLHQRKLDDLKQLKKALLQQMFV